MKVFIERRLAPGIRTCNAVRDRLEDLSRRISQAADLLRTRVELAIQGQNVAVPLLMLVSWRVIHRVRRRVQGE